MAKLLSDERWLPNGTLRLAQFVAMAEAKGVPFVVGESNSVSCGGGAGVSNTFASSLWVPHFLAELSKGGVERVNIHGGRSRKKPVATENLLENTDRRGGRSTPSVFSRGGSLLPSATFCLC